MNCVTIKLEVRAPKQIKLVPGFSNLHPFSPFENAHRN